MPLETSITERILKYLNEEIECCVAEKVAGNAFTKDRPDINACWKGLAVRIEVKSPDHDNKPTKGQLLDLKKWKRAGALTMVAYSLLDVKKVINND